MKTPKPIALSVNELEQLLSYCPETGVFTWKHRPEINRWDKNHNNRRAGTEAGISTGKGYRQIRCKGQLILAHRLAFYMMTGEQPDMVDHIDGDKTNNKWNNLRAATNQQNAMNQALRSNNQSGRKGVSQSRNGKWKAVICRAQVHYHLGTFERFEDAVIAREAAERRLFGEWNRAR